MVFFATLQVSAYYMYIKIIITLVSKILSLVLANNPFDLHTGLSQKKAVHTWANSHHYILFSFSINSYHTSQTGYEWDIFLWPCCLAWLVLSFSIAFVVNYIQKYISVVLLITNLKV